MSSITLHEQSSNSTSLFSIDVFALLLIQWYLKGGRVFLLDDSDETNRCSDDLLQRDR